MAYQTFRQEYLAIPIVTRVYTTACVITTIAVVRILLEMKRHIIFVYQRIKKKKKPRHLKEPRAIK